MSHDSAAVGTSSHSNDFPTNGTFLQSNGAFGTGHLMPAGLKNNIFSIFETDYAFCIRPD